MVVIKLDVSVNLGKQSSCYGNKNRLPQKWNESDV